jgi:hypothetical protein
MIRIQSSSMWRTLSAPTAVPSRPAGTMMRTICRSQRPKYALTPARSIRHGTGNRMAAACAGGMVSAISGVATAAPPPSPPFENPVRATAGTASAQNQGSAINSV